MPRKFIKRFLPNPDTLKEHKHLRLFGKWIHDPNLWHLHRRNVATAFSVGLFCAFIPVPFQMVLAAAGAILFRANLPLSVVLVWTSNPITMPPLFYGAYKLGAWLMNWPIEEFEFELSFAWISNSLQYYWQPFLLGCLVAGVATAILSNLMIRGFWRLSVSRAWNERKLRIAKKINKKSASN